VKVLVAVDLGERGRAVVREAVVWAERMQATLDLVYVDSSIASAGYVHDPSIRAVVLEEGGAVRAEHVQALDALLNEVPEPYRGIARCLDGRAGRVLVDASEVYDALIIATHGRKGFDRFWLGSVAEEVVRDSLVPVLVMRMPKVEDDS